MRGADARAYRTRGSFLPWAEETNGEERSPLGADTGPHAAFNNLHLELETMNALDLLKQQHDEVKKLFKKYEKLADHADEKRQELFEAIADRLGAHAAIEEQYFYPAAKAEDTEDLLREAAEEHLSAKRIIADLLEMEPSDEEFDAKMQVLQEQIEHHVEEEEGDLFKKVRKLLSKEQLEDLGLQMQQEFEELMEGEPREQVPSETDQAAPI
jgi:hemerythrin superfamily protein